jgi:hypothetical protein
MRRSQPLSRALAVLALAGVALTGLATAGPATTALASAQRDGLAPARPAAAATGPAWPVHDLARENARLRSSSQVISVARREGFALLTNLAGTQFQLERFAVTGGHVLPGPKFAVGRLLLADGFLWVYGEIPASRDSPFARQVLYQVSEQTLAVVRSRVLTPRHRAKFLDDVEVAPGPRHSVWVGFQRTLLRISTTSGAIIRRERVPAGVFIDDLATDPGLRHVYVGAEPSRGGATLFEYLARSGRQQPPVRGRSIRFALNGPALTGVPGGVFGVYRTGMAGQVSLLSQRDLRIQPLHNPVFAFFNSASAVYASKVLFLTQLGGRTACVSPGGVVRHSTTLAAVKDGSDLLAADPSAHLVYALGPHGLLAITPPASCWG